MPNFYMKQLIIGLIAFYTTIHAYSQDSTLTLSKFEKFYTGTGKMTRTDHGKVGDIRDITVSLHRITDLESGDTSKAVSVHQGPAPVYSAIVLGNLYVDLDEIPGVIKALEFYRSEIKKGKPKYQPYFVYVTTNDIVVSCSYAEMGMFSGWSVSMSRRYTYSKVYVPGSGVTVRNKDIDDLANLLNESLLVKFR